MAKKTTEEVIENKVNGFVEKQEEVVTETAKPRQDVTISVAPVKKATPGHTTRAFRG